MSSGVGVSEECIASFQDIKSHRKFKYIIYGLNPTNTEIIVLKASNETDYDVFVGELPGNECRWAVYDFEYEVEGGKRNKLVFYSWSPDEATIKSKMVFSSSKTALRNSLGLSTEIQGTDFDEVAYESVLDKIRRLR
ncbi:hypothetical protein EW026_g2302 [Hermanssonia centrifuga]|uniref:Cofilin n=1 Tax=Hermanssonia centrifuga TaxID=98765 RepID=A0A4S4KTA8_9APHY|nr:hypothetical protein EW026_g2302 [Hermanssonia centrifuga]